MKTTIVLGVEQDYHARHILNALIENGSDALLLDVSKFPVDHCMSFDPITGKGLLTISGKKIKFSDIRSVFWSTITAVGIPLSKNEESYRMAQLDAMSVLRTFLLEQDILWANSWEAYQFHIVKPRQLALASSIGANIPATIIGNDSNGVIKFAGVHKKAIYKPVYGGAHTAFLTKDMLERERLNRVLSISPVTIQQYIPGTNVRSYVIGEQVFSAELKSDNVDFRQEESLEHIVLNLPEEINRLAINITRQFGMKWTAIDWRHDEQGNFYFLEANPSPMFVHFEKMTGLPITERLVQLLLRTQSELSLTA